MAETIRFKNPTAQTVKLRAVGMEDVPPGGEVDVPLELVAAGRAANGSRRKSALECVAPQLIASSEVDRAVLGETPSPPTPISKIVSIAKRLAPQEAPGVKQLREKREAALQVEAAKKAASAPVAKPPETVKAS